MCALRLACVTHVEMPFRKHSGHGKHKYALHLRDSVCGVAGLIPTFLDHYAFSGTTDGHYVVGVGWSADPEQSIRHSLHPPLRRSLCHFWLPAESTADMKACASPAPTRSGRDWHAHCILHDVAARMEGLFLVASSTVDCIGPSVFHPGKSVRRQLTRSEFLRLFDSAVSRLCWQLSRGPAPFEEALPPTIWAWILRTLWGNDGGGFCFVFFRVCFTNRDARWTFFC